MVAVLIGEASGMVALISANQVTVLVVLLLTTDAKLFKSKSAVPVPSSHSDEVVEMASGMALIFKVIITGLDSQFPSDTTANTFVVVEVYKIGMELVVLASLYQLTPFPVLLLMIFSKEAKSNKAVPVPSSQAESEVVEAVGALLTVSVTGTGLETHDPSSTIA